jgi:two-component sensor histidine kinase
MPADMDLSTTESVGLSMIYNVVTVQLKGTIELLDGTGTTYHICIPGIFVSEQNPSDTTGESP